MTVTPLPNLPDPRLRDQPCDFCGWAADGFVWEAGSYSVVVRGAGIVHHETEDQLIQWCRTDRVIVCPWCRPHVEVSPDLTARRKFQCPVCRPMEPEVRAEIVLRRAGGEGPGGPPW